MFDLTAFTITQNYENSYERLRPRTNTSASEDSGVSSSNLEIHCNNLSIEVAEFVLKNNDEDCSDMDSEYKNC